MALFLFITIPLIGFLLSAIPCIAIIVVIVMATVIVLRRGGVVMPVAGRRRGIRRRICAIGIDGATG
ncbi:MAG: hypothetical protein BWK76_08960 [Desulfobulbaceae bacterium A2]|nr:MAG: hypothetical protein BWK76_08960 [Desulfobulbaceae bacterium A2]